MDVKKYPIEEIVPHSYPMILIDELLSITEKSAIARVDIKPDCILLDPNGECSAATGIEWMAQTIAAHAGYFARQQQKTVEIGFLLGTRRYRSTRSTFFSGDQYIVKVEQLYLEDGMASFACEIIDNEDVIVTATINTYQPDHSKVADVIGEPSE
ncbi:3-hydroxylacyl-ACP dehydratase [Corallincola holothuriorum]|uniref:3-hydroxylacyl-ACP dehydratase n=1 Tax=Corallincola holothuriorum TaxID=2282215 RepID=A0A368NS77_9GAMM|nr:hotdog family protein [Corallincola holothuriorum]RCU52793.1 3-hydroxylacyl-ACP dehydratase [Corallincola holothuriorum]